MKKNERLLALKILLQWMQDKKPLGFEDENIPPLSKEICFGVCRHIFQLEKLADKLFKSRPKRLEIWILTLMGLYQLQHLSKPAYATVKETVDVLDDMRLPWAKGLVNAILRRFCREQAALLALFEDDSEYIYNHPLWFINAMQNDWPTDWEAILKANNGRALMSLRINQLKINRESYLKRLKNQGIKAFPLLYSPVGIGLESPCSVNDLPGFKEGQIFIQDESAQLAASLCDLKPGLRVLDACCAPGGKLTHLLETQPSLKACIGIDNEKKRLALVRQNLTRLQLNANLLAADASQIVSWWDGIPFDRILLDAPCSATGIIRRHPDIKYLKTADSIAKVIEQQQRLLNALWPLLQDNGLLIYATCSVMKRENEEQIRLFLRENPQAQVSKEVFPWGVNTGFGWQIFPKDKQGDGFFYCVLEKKNGEYPHSPR